jgi:hypothetical protein
MSCKRNQVEEAISRVLDPGSTKPSPQLRTRLKRLLDTDRALGRSKRASDPERATFAFYSGQAPGRGVEIWFSEYEAFALLTGLRLMQNGWPQRFAVSQLRRLRGAFETHHAQILKQGWGEPAIRQQPQPGDVEFYAADPVFLVVQRQQDGTGSPSSTVCRGEQELMPVLRREAGVVSTTFELAKSARALSSELARTKPRKRGRGSA